MTKPLHPSNGRRTCARLVVLFAFVLHGFYLPAHLSLHEHLEPEAHLSAHLSVHLSVEASADATVRGQNHHHGDHAPHSALDHASGPIAWRKAAPPITIDLLSIAVVAQWTTEVRHARSASDRQDLRRSRPTQPIPFPRGPPAAV